VHQDAPRATDVPVVGPPQEARKASPALRKIAAGEDKAGAARAKFVLRLLEKMPKK